MGVRRRDPSPDSSGNRYERWHESVLAALVREDPMELSAPDNDLRDEYDSEAREIARRLVHANGNGGRDEVVTVIDGVFVASFGSGLPRAQAQRIAAAIAELHER